MPNAEEFNLGCTNLVRTVQAMKGRAVSIRQPFGNVEELAEIGLLTMRIAELEELVSLFCEVLLIRPELGGLHAPKKAVLTKQLAEKLTLYKALTIASGVLYSIDTEPVEESIAAAKSVGEDRNTIIHGLIGPTKDGGIAFQGRNGEVRASLDVLRSVNKKCHDVAAGVVTCFRRFYTDLAGKKSDQETIESTVQASLQSWLTLHDSADKARKQTQKLRELETAQLEALRKLEDSREQFAVAKRALRNAKARERRIKAKGKGAKRIGLDETTPC